MSRGIGELPRNLKRERVAGSGTNRQREIKKQIPVVRRAKFGISVYAASDSSNQPVLNANLNRSYLLIQNNGTSDVFVNFASKANTQSIKIIAGGNYEPLVAPIDSIYLVSGTGLSNICAIAEGVEVN